MSNRKYLAVNISRQVLYVRVDGIPVKVEPGEYVVMSDKDRLVFLSDPVHKFFRIDDVYDGADLYTMYSLDIDSIFAVDDELEDFSFKVLAPKSVLEKSIKFEYDLEVSYANIFGEDGEITTIVNRFAKYREVKYRPVEVNYVYNSGNLVLVELRVEDVASLPLYDVVFDEVWLKESTGEVFINGRIRVDASLRSSVIKGTLKTSLDIQEGSFDLELIKEENKMANAQVRAPYIDYLEQDQALNSTGEDITVVGIVGAAGKGPIGVGVPITSTNVLKSTFGGALVGQGTGADYGLMAAEVVIKNGGIVIYHRVADDNVAIGSGIGAAIKVETLEKTDTLNGFMVKVEFDGVNKPILVKLSRRDGVLVESFKAPALASGSSVEEAYSKLVEYVNKRSKLIKLEAVEDIESGATETVEIAGGNNGAAALGDAALVGGISSFSNKNNTDIDVLIAPGRNSTEVIKAFKWVSDQRRDVMCLIDPPLDCSVAGMADFIDGRFEGNTEALDSKYMAVYYPWLVSDVTNFGEVVVPPSVYVAGQWCYSDSVNSVWYAPAGFGEAPAIRGRGLMRGVKDVVEELDQNDLDYLYGSLYVNPIVKYISKGIVLWGNVTCERDDVSLFTSISVTRLALYIRKEVYRISLEEIFNPNDMLTWHSFKNKLEPILRNILNGRGISNFRVEMDNTTMSAEDIAGGILRGNVLIQPVNAVEFINISFTATQDDTVFADNDLDRLGESIIEYGIGTSDN